MFVITRKRPGAVFSGTVTEPCHLDTVISNYAMLFRQNTKTHVGIPGDENPCAAGHTKGRSETGFDRFSTSGPTNALEHDFEEFIGHFRGHSRASFCRYGPNTT